jgi:ParB-like chromosome segregation protein Spo0J
MEIKLFDINEIKSNPNNPRIIKDDKFKKLVKSIKEFPQMLQLRPIVVNDDYVVLGGNMRLKACIEAGLKKIPVILASELNDEQQKEFIIKDNLGYGEWDWTTIADEWNLDDLENWGLDLPKFIKYEDMEDISNEVVQSYKIEIECKSEEEQQKIYNELIEKNYTCHLLTL